ncbi:MAG TPA: ATP-binding protein, partial [Kofleriaceae bacterium]|nr:ATP-binding protein [Kofleriaceae bacterium]
RADAPRDEGIVGDVIAQFADIYAFYRELIQNSIDAGSPSIEVELTYDRAEQRMRVAVRDRGEGMTRDIVENQLLVLFRSTKEKDSTKIGKFGIGFASVLAPNPEVVTVQTARDKRRLTLHLYRDLSYDLFDAGPATLNGTTVELTLVMKPQEVDKFAISTLDALTRWCRHATVPIELIENRADGKVTKRIDSPLGLASTLVEVKRVTDDGQLTVVVGLGAPYVGFFNHGLMLHETTEPLVGPLSAKIQDSRLGHTLSRDDVRRDASFDRALAFAKEVVQTDLTRAAETRLRELAETGKLQDVERLVSAAIAAEIRLERWVLPLVDAIGETKVADIRQARRAWASNKSSPLTAELARQAIPVFRCSDIELFAADIERALGCKVHPVERWLTCVSPVERTPHDEALLATLVDILNEAYRDPGAVMLAELIGAHADGFAISGTSTDAHVVDRDAAAKNPFALLGRRPLVLSVTHPLVKAARTHDDPQLAAAHLARAVLLQHRLLDAGRSARILERALANSGAG